LRDARGLDDRRTALAVGEARGFLFVRVNPPERLSIGVVYSHQIMVMPPAAILAKLGFLVPDGPSGYLAGGFGHDESLNST
jgi:hypothetical protein